MVVLLHVDDHEVVVAVVLAVADLTREDTGDVDEAGTTTNASVSPFLVCSGPSRETSSANATTASLADTFAHVQRGVHGATSFL